MGLLANVYSVYTGAGVLVFELAFYVLIAIALGGVFQKAGQPGWAGFVPIYNFYIMLKIVGRPTWWTWFPAPASSRSSAPSHCWSSTSSSPSTSPRASGTGGGFAIGLIIPPFIFYNILGWGRPPTRARQRSAAARTFGRASSRMGPAALRPAAATASLRLRPTSRLRPASRLRPPRDTARPTRVTASRSPDMAHPLATTSPRRRTRPRATTSHRPPTRLQATTSRLPSSRRSRRIRRRRRLSVPQFGGTDSRCRGGRSDCRSRFPYATTVAAP